LVNFHIINEIPQVIIQPEIINANNPFKFFPILSPKTGKPPGEVKLTPSFLLKAFKQTWEELNMQIWKTFGLIIAKFSLRVLLRTLKVSSLNREVPADPDGSMKTTLISFILSLLTVNC